MMKTNLFPRPIVVLVLLMALLSLACSISAPAGLFGPSCQVKDGSLVAWSSSRTMLITFKVDGCKIINLNVALNPAVSVAGNTSNGTLPQIWLSDPVTIQGNQFAMGPTKGVAMTGTFTTPTEVEGTLQVAKGSRFDSNPLISFTTDLNDTWSGSIK
jgi:hypothetical protein